MFDFPLFLIGDGNDIVVCHSVEEAQRVPEPVDVVDNMWRCFDAKGRKCRLTASAEQVRTSKWIVSTNVPIQITATDETDEVGLRAILAKAVEDHLSADEPIDLDSLVTLYLRYRDFRWPK